MRDVNELVDVVFSGLLPLVIEDVTDEGERILVRARTSADMVPCPSCGAPSGRVHGFLPADGGRRTGGRATGSSPCAGAAAGVSHARLSAHLP